MKRVCCFLLLSLIVSSSQAESVWGIWGGTWLSTVPFGTLRGKELAGRGVTLLAFHYAHPIVQSKNNSLLYTIDALPVVIAIKNESLNGERKSAYGFGANPVGFQWDLLRERNTHPFAFITGGFLKFNEPTPTPTSTRWNFSADAGGGLEIALHNRKTISIGYRLHHISNGGIGRSNPSLNTNLVFVGFNLLR